MLSLYSTTSFNKVEQLVDQTSSRGGAGYVYKDERDYNILAFGYLDKNTAESVKEKVGKEVSSTKIIELEAPKLKAKAISSLNQNPKLRKVYEHLIKTVDNIYSLSVEYEKNNNVAYIYRELEVISANLEQMVDICKNSLERKKIGDVLTISANVYLSLIEICLDEIYKMNSVLKNLRNLYISCCFEEINLRNSLNKL